MTSTGGLQNIGDFDEGYCFRLRMRTKIIWDMCSDKAAEKAQWMNLLFPLIHQMGANSQGQSASISGGGGMSSSVSTKFVYNASLWFNSTDQDSQLTKRRDGKWVVIHDWSQCSRACGGGKSFQQRMCIPPVGGGRICFGESIIEKHCNEQPCPSTIIDNMGGGSGGTSGSDSVLTTTTASPQIRVQQLSNRIQRFTPCVVKESFVIC